MLESTRGGAALEVHQFIDGLTRCVVWELPDSGWADWAAVVDRFLTHAIRGIAAEYTGSPVEWLEVNHWQNSGRLIVFPSQNGPHGDRGERVCFELSSKYLESAARFISDNGSATEQERSYAGLVERVWQRVGECLVGGSAAVELAAARRSHKMRIAGYDYNPGEGPLRLTEAGGPQEASSDIV